MLTDLRNIKGSTELSAMSMWILVSGDNRNVLNLVFTLYVRVLGQGSRHGKVTTSLLPQLTLPVEATIARRLVIPLLSTAFRQSILSQILFSITTWLCSNILKQHYICLAEWPFKLAQATSLSSARRNTVLGGNLNCL